MKIVLTDLADTIIYFRDHNIEAACKALRQIGDELPSDEQALLPIYKMSRPWSDRYLREQLERIGIDDFPGAYGVDKKKFIGGMKKYGRFDRKYLGKNDCPIRLFPDTREYLIAMREARIPVAVATSMKKEGVDLLIDRFETDHLLTAAVASRDGYMSGDPVV